LDEENEVPGEEHNQLKQMMRSEPGIVVGATSRSCRLKNSSKFMKHGSLHAHPK
jgi:hypothetical protein